MSAIAGILNTDGAPVDEELLLRMREIVDYRGPDGAGLWVNGKVGFAHRLLWTTEESVYEKQPFTHGRGLWIVADCRIDNREELKREFLLRGLCQEGPFPLPDVGYILVAYERWGEEAPNHLLGDFSFAIWDERHQKLFCARDQIGLKPFVYHWNGQKFLFGSEMKQLFQDSLVPRGLNILHLADILAMAFPNREETPYQAIRRLPPAHSMVIEKGRLQIQRYWNWNPDSEPESKASLEENAETFRHLFQEAVHARLRTPPGYRVGSLLSGGLDSSSIVSVAAREVSPFPVFNLHFPEANPRYQFKNKDPVDESPYVESLLQKHPLELHRVEIKGWGPFHNLEENLWRQEIPLFFPNLAYFQYLFKIAGNSGVRVLLHGEGGDELFAIGPQCFMNELKKGNLPKFFKEFLSRHRKEGASYLGLLARTFLALLPDWIKIPYHRFFRKIVPPWIRGSFAKQYHLRKRIEKDFRWNPHLRGSSSSCGILHWLLTGFIPTSLETINRAAQWGPIEIRLPFLDLRLLRLSGTIPWDLKRRDGVNKFLLREALKDFLPGPIQMRSQKAEFTPVIRASLERYATHQFEEMFENPHSLLQRMTLLNKVKGFYKNYFSTMGSKSPKKITESFWPLWHHVSVDQWLKREENLWKKWEENWNEKQKRLVLAKKEN